MDFGHANPFRHGRINYLTQVHRWLVQYGLLTPNFRDYKEFMQIFTSGLFSYKWQPKIPRLSVLVFCVFLNGDHQE